MIWGDVSVAMYINLHAVTVDVALVDLELYKLIHRVEEDLNNYTTTQGIGKIHMCMCVYMCMCVGSVAGELIFILLTHIHIYTHTYTHIHTHTHTHTHTNTHTHTHTHIHPCTHDA